MAGTSLHLYHAFGQKSAMTPAVWATRSLLLGSRCRSLLLFLAPLKIPGGCAVFLCSCFTYCREDGSVHGHSWGLWMQACFIPWRYYDGVCVTPSKSRWVLTHTRGKSLTGQAQCQGSGGGMRGSWRRWEEVIWAARKAEKWSWVKSFWPSRLRVSQTSFPSRAVGSRAHPGWEPWWLEGRCFWLVLLWLTRSLLHWLLVAVTKSFHPSEEVQGVISGGLGFLVCFV